jgi:hypothetical protein
MWHIVKHCVTAIPSCINRAECEKHRQMKHQIQVTYIRSVAKIVAT